MLNLENDSCRVHSKLGFGIIPIEAETDTEMYLLSSSCYFTYKERRDRGN